MVAPEKLLTTPTIPLVSRSLFQPGSFGSALIASDGRIASVTRSFAQMLGCPVRTLFGQSITSVLQATNSPKLSSLLTDGTATTVETRNGKSLCWTVNRVAQGAALGGYYIGLLYDADRLVELDQRLVHQERLAMLGRLTATVSHEIVGPLSAMANGAELLLEKDGIDNETTESLTSMLEEADRIQSLLRSILRFARNAPIQTSPQDAAKLVRKSARIIGRQSIRARVNVKIEVEPGLPRVTGDGEHLQQVFTNLIKNACDASSDGQEIVIRLANARLSSGEAAVEITVTDQGTGINPTDLQRVFEPFYSTKAVGEGTGLGLTISQRIVSAHGGELHISSPPGNGTRVTVLLPAFITKRSARLENSETMSRGQRLVTTR
jgi:signal transduction histidine kinase